ncbi:protein of unknown function [Pararobbsia alpina]
MLSALRSQGRLSCARPFRLLFALMHQLFDYLVQLLSKCRAQAFVLHPVYDGGGSVIFASGLDAVALDVLADL